MRFSALLSSTMVIGVTAALLVGCGGDDNGGGGGGGGATAAPCPTSARNGLAVAVGARANSPAPKLPPVIATYLQDIPREKGYTIVRVDGAPSIVCADVFSSNAKSDVVLAAERRAFGQRAVNQMRATVAREAEADPLSALRLAASAAGPGGTVVLVDSGLQTKAPLDFRAPGTLFMPPGEIVRQLRKEPGQLPDLTGRHVVLSGIGYTARPQKSLGGLQRRLVEIWKAIASAGGAETVEVVEGPNTDPSVSKAPKVSAVSIPEPDPVSPSCDSSLDFPDGGAVGFEPEKATFRDQGRARATLSTVADWLRSTPSARVMAVGTIAHHGANVKNGGLAMERARAVADTLVDLGVASSRVTARGAGWGPYQGTGDEVDKRNRRVVLTITC
ncbi:OmpA family protein [Micromonospora sp. WMMD1274]|uniref:OmpA family protein n=1 Tax=Micromonospora sp. WMMD1274 TaxID=3404116 RepID=UPI003B932F90